MIVEIIIGILTLLLILGMFGGSMLLMFVIMPLMQKAALDKRFPIEVPGWGMKLNSTPPMNATVEDIAAGLQVFLDRAVEVKGYNKKDLKKKIDNLVVEFIRPTNEEGARYIVDQWGRKIAGDHTGDHIRVVVLKEDTLGRTAFFHEVGHEAHELENLVDYDHEDKVMWNDIVSFCKKKF